MFLDVQNLTLRYGSSVALDDVTLKLPGGRIGLLGPNGAGKSTLMKILLGLIRPTSGNGTILGHDIRKVGPEVRRLIGYMPEADALAPGTPGVEYVALAGELYGMPAKQALRRAHEMLSSLGLDDARYRKLEEYSTGMKQRLKLAQALVHDPPALLLDEPTSGLDPAGRDAMLDLLRRLGVEHGKTILLSTHLLGDVDTVCDTVVILHQGKVRCFGPARELCQSRRNRYKLRIQGDSPSFLEDLRLEGVEILTENDRGELRVRVPDGWSARAFFVLADHAGIVVRGVETDDEDLEELFHRVVDPTTGSGEAP